MHKSLLVILPTKLCINGLLFRAGWWQSRKRQRQSKGKSGIPLPKGWTTGKMLHESLHAFPKGARRGSLSSHLSLWSVPSGAYPQALEDPHNQPWSCRSHSSRVQCCHPRVSHRRSRFCSHVLSWPPSAGAVCVIAYALFVC